MWDELSGGIINLLNTLTTVDTSIGIYDYEHTNMPGYPCITVTPADNAAEFGDTRRNERSYFFSIKNYQQRSDPDKAEGVMRRLVDSEIALFDANQLLDDVNGYGRLNGRGFCRPIPSAWRYIQTEQVDVRMAEVLLECVVIQ